MATFRFSKELLEIGWDILEKAGFAEEFAYITLPQSWIEEKKINLYKFQIRSGPYVLMDTGIIVGNDYKMRDYSLEIEEAVCNCQNSITAEKMPEYMYDLIIYCKSK